METPTFLVKHKGTDQYVCKIKHHTIQSKERAEMHLGVIARDLDYAEYDLMVEEVVLQ